MAERKTSTAAEKTPAVAGNESAVDNTTTHGDHDRVAMLSLRQNGAPDQVNPEFIVPREQALAATTEQFKQQASASIVTDPTGPVTIIGKPGDEDDEIVPATANAQDPGIAAKQDERQQAEAKAEENAKATVDALLPDEPKES